MILCFVLILAHRIGRVFSPSRFTSWCSGRSCFAVRKIISLLFWFGFQVDCLSTVSRFTIQRFAIDQRFRSTFSINIFDQRLRSTLSINVFDQRFRSTLSFNVFDQRFKNDRLFQVDQRFQIVFDQRFRSAFSYRSTFLIWSHVRICVGMLYWFVLPTLCCFIDPLNH